MKNSVYFYLLKTDENITSISDFGSMPNLKKGDTFWFNMSDYFPITICKLKEQWKDSFVDGLVTDNKLNKEKLGNTRYKIVHIYRCLEHDPNHEDVHTMVVEYGCKIANPIHWKFWNTYAFRQFFKELFKNPLNRK